MTEMAESSKPRCRNYNASRSTALWAALRAWRVGGQAQLAEKPKRDKLARLPRVHPCGGPEHQLRSGLPHWRGLV